MFGFGESTVMSEPGESSLDDPALSQKAKAVPEPWNDRKTGALTPEEFAHPSNELTAIGRRQQSSRAPTEPSSFLDHELGSVAILNGCRVDHRHQDQAQGVNQKVAFSPTGKHLHDGAPGLSGTFSLDRHVSTAPTWRQGGRRFERL
jgi:hypothetical protein